MRKPTRPKKQPVYSYRRWKERQDMLRHIDRQDEGARAIFCVVIMLVIVSWLGHNWLQ